MENRFFAFGCSFTQYLWPTWADLIGQKFKEDYYNYGKPGAGNNYIYNKIMEVDQRYSFNENDLVIVEWSSCFREDRYKNNAWNTQVLNNLEPSLWKFLFDERGFLIRDLALIKGAKNLLENKKCKFIFISLCGISSNSAHDVNYKNSTETDSDVMQLYKDVLDIIKPSFFDILGNYTNRPLHLRDDIYLTDAHHIPSEYYKYICEILPEYADCVTLDEVESYDNLIKESYVPPNNMPNSWRYVLYAGLSKKDEGL